MLVGRDAAAETGERAASGFPGASRQRAATELTDPSRQYQCAGSNIDRPGVVEMVANWSAAPPLVALNVPWLLKVLPLPVLRTFVLLMFQIALGSFITVPPLAKLRFELPPFPMLTLAVPKFSRVRPDTSGLPLAIVRPPWAIVVPVPLIKVLLNVVTPLTVSVSLPVNVPPVSVNVVMPIARPMLKFNVPLLTATVVSEPIWVPELSVNELLLLETEMLPEMLSLLLAKVALPPFAVETGIVEDRAASQSEGPASQVHDSARVQFRRRIKRIAAVEFQREA